jgi:transcriptional regulator with XRE-family HTH domain
LIKAKNEPVPPTEPLLRYDYRAFSVELGEKIKQLRKDSGLTLRNLIVQHDFHLTQIQKIERGEGISVPTLLRVAEVFQIPLEKLVEGVGLVQSTEPRSKSTKK